jgi:hypothetical protein
MQKATRSTVPGAQGVPVPEELRAQVAALVQAIGEGAALERLGVSRTTLPRLAAGFTVRAGTLALVRERLAAKEGG